MLKKEYCKQVENSPYTKNTHNNTKTRRKPRRNRHSEKKHLFLCFSDCVVIFFFIYNFLNDCTSNYCHNIRHALNE